MKFLDKSDSRLVDISRLVPMTEFEKTLWKIDD